MAGRERQPWWDIPLTLVVAIAVMVLITTFLAKPFAIPSGSMEPALQVGDRVLANRAALWRGEVQRGDIVVFDGTDSFVPASQVSDASPLVAPLRWVGQAVGVLEPNGTEYVKRVIGVGGDRVRCCDAEGRISVNGRPIDESGYLMAGNAPSDQSFDVEVPAGMLWLMGDHRSNSADSRSHLGDPGGGMVSQSRVIGRVTHILWPFDRLSSVPDTRAFEAVPGGSHG